MRECVAILGASDKPGRFSYRALVALQEKGFTVVLVNPRLDEIGGVRCFATLQEYVGVIDTVTVYVRPEILLGVVEEVIALKPKRVILNPGSENRTVVERLQQAGIRVQVACTLVMLSMGEF